MKTDEQHIRELYRQITKIVSETNGITIEDTLELMVSSSLPTKYPEVGAIVVSFREALSRFKHAKSEIDSLMDHPFSKALYLFFQGFPLPYREEHIHLTGSLSSEFIFPRLTKVLDSPAGQAVRQKIEAVYGPDSFPIESVEDVDRLLRLKRGERFDRYLQILMLPKLLLIDRQSHAEAAYHMAHDLYHKYNVGALRLKFTLSRATSDADESIPGIQALTSEDVAMGLFEGFDAFRKEVDSFEFILSPSFRKESSFFDNKLFRSKREDVNHQIDTILRLLQNHPCLVPHLREVDTVGNERDFYRKIHFYDMQNAFRKLQYNGFQIRSHHGETWTNLRRGIQAVDNAMNIWDIGALEHGLSLGINPNYYFHSMYQRVLRANEAGHAIAVDSPEFHEINDMLWDKNEGVRDKLLAGERLSEKEVILFTKAKFHTAARVEHYQHDVLNRMIHKNVSLISLPSSNNKLTSYFTDYKDHPFSWWEKKGLKLGVGTDNYITLNTNFIKEMMILLYTDPTGLKITKLLMVTTGETRRPYISNLLWKMNTRFPDNPE